MKTRLEDAEAIVVWATFVFFHVPTANPTAHVGFTRGKGYLIANLSLKTFHEDAGHHVASRTGSPAGKLSKVSGTQWECGEPGEERENAANFCL